MRSPGSTSTSSASRWTPSVAHSSISMELSPRSLSFSSPATLTLALNRTLHPALGARHAQTYHIPRRLLSLSHRCHLSIRKGNTDQGTRRPERDVYPHHRLR